MKTLHFSTIIDAGREAVWNTFLASDSLAQVDLRVPGGREMTPSRLLAGGAGSVFLTLNYPPATAGGSDMNVIAGPGQLDRDTSLENS